MLFKVESDLCQQTKRPDTSQTDPLYGAMASLVSYLQVHWG